jgi:hypothetical protein
MAKQTKTFGPASEKQRMILSAQEDIVLVGGGKLVPPR